jgi:hypothetical protein
MTQREPLGPPPVEPLSDAAWSRVERGLWSRLDAAAPAPAPATPAPRRWAWIAVPALAAAVGALAVAMLSLDRRGDAPGDAPARVVSGASPSSVTFGEIHVTLDADSAVVMSPAAGAAPRAVVERGAAWFAVAPRTGAPFVVTAGDAIVRVVGTRFRVARAGEEATVEVEHGIVEVQFQGATARVGAGQRWTSRQPAAVRVAASAAPATADPVAPPVAAAPPPSGIPEVGRAPAPAPAPAVGPRRAPARAEPAPRAARAAPSPPSASTPTPAPAAPPAAGADDDAARFRRLEALEPRRADAAIRGYLELARGDGPWAAPALFAAARLAADRRQPRARTLLETYLQRFPAGANAAAARALLDALPSAP